ncbi:PhoH family protein [Egicoccus halophilus]|uniref:ATP-binding protein n=1 Tax=Egicoccus halophilus TaxID=1670830 RepID=A0A8J3AAE7_9ACTN|nr:PhoH family protein [Egicoccus halophilus]GGI08999.1 ATP-binding protein [Egicoccus halophilus]
MSTMTRATTRPRAHRGGRTYVLDTCVLLADPNALFRFDEHDVVLPLVVIEELDRKKTQMDDVGRNARLALRAIEDLRVQQPGGLRDALPLPSGGSVRIESNHVDVPLPPYLDKAKADHRILCVAIGLRGTLVTKDAGLRIKASQLGVEVEDYRGDTARTSEHDVGIVELEVDPAFLDALHRDGKAVLERDEVDLRPAGGALWPNACLVLKAGRSSSGLGRVLDVDDEGSATVHRVAGHRAVFGMAPRDVRQTFAIDLLLDPDVPCVSLMGMAGTGKTFLALAAGLEQVLEATAYRRLSVYRPLIAVGRQEIGYLPGDLDEKLAPWMAAVHDNLYALLRRNEPATAPRGAREHRQIQSTIDSLIDRGQLELAAITYLRGRSITDEFVIVDEAQNIELSALKVVLTRMATGSKVVFCGDLGQVDNPYISPYGGMAALIEKMKGSPLFGHVTLSKGVRSPLAEHAATIF